MYICVKAYINIFTFIFELIYTLYKNYKIKVKFYNLRKFSTMDILVPISMKNAAKCDMQCELQNSVSHQIFERIPR